MIKKRRMTNRELAKWLAQGNGESINTQTKMCLSQCIYFDEDPCERDDECSEHIRIRAWDEEEWREPLVEIEE